MNTTAGRRAPEAALPGLELQHDFYLLLPNWKSWTAVAEALSAAGGEVLSLQLLRQREGYGGRCRVRSVSSEEARLVSAKLIESGIAQQASVEHLMLKAEPAT
jgi:hypothetical protein